MDLKKYASVLIFALQKARRGGKFKKGDNILISYDMPALALAEEVYSSLLEQGYNVFPRPYLTENMSKTLFGKASDAQLKFVPEWEKVFTKNLNGLIALRAPQNLANLKNADPKRIAMATIAKKSLRILMDEREERGLFSWTLANFPTEGLAKQAELTPQEYEKQIIKACFLKEKDPVKKWEQVMGEIEAVSKRLSSLPIEIIRTQSASMDLEIAFGEKRKFISGGGCNIPSFEIFTSPDWRGTKGIYYSDLMSFRDGNYVKGITLEFKGGRVVSAKAEQGEDFLKKMLSLDRGASQIGEYSLTDTRFSKIDSFMADTLYDENFGGKFGNSHIALGSSYADTFSGNLSKLDAKLKKQLGYNQSALHWDLVNTQDKLVTVKLKNGKKMTVYEKGRFTI